VRYSCSGVTYADPRYEDDASLPTSGSKYSHSVCTGGPFMGDVSSRIRADFAGIPAAAGNGSLGRGRIGPDRPKKVKRCRFTAVLSAASVPARSA
jgi:hypothetical protein